VYMVGRRLAVAIASASLVVPMVAGCGPEGTKPNGSPKAGGASTGAAGSAGESKKQQSIDMRRREENMIAACMKKSGFTYVPYVPQSMLNPPAPEPTDYASLKAFRGKYGFGDLYAPLVYPGDPNIAPPPEEPDPNDAIFDGLDPVQQKAYLKALNDDYQDKSGPLKLIGGCIAEAVKAVDQRAWKGAKYRFDHLGGHDPDVNSPEFKEKCEATPACKNYDADEARLKPLRDAYGSCLKRQGYPDDGNVYELDQTARRTLIARYDKLDKDPDLFRTKIDPVTARVELRKEIKVALEDLECGKDYIATNAEIEAEHEELAPPSGGLP
jgi:hypothetical protein